VRAVPRPDVDEGSGRADAQRAEQELFVLRGVDPEQHEVRRVRHPAQGLEDGRRLRRLGFLFGQFSRSQNCEKN